MQSNSEFNSFSVALLVVCVKEDVDVNERRAVSVAVIEGHCKANQKRCDGHTITKKNVTVTRDSNVTRDFGMLTKLTSRRLCFQG